MLALVRVCACVYPGVWHRGAAPGTGGRGTQPCGPPRSDKGGSEGEVCAGEGKEGKMVCLGAFGKL